MSTLSITSKSPMPDVESEASDPDGDLRRIMRAGEAASDPTLCDGPGHTTIGRVCVCAEDGVDWFVTIPSGAVLPAKVALSCVVRPQHGDLVQAYVVGNRCWLLAVLERNAGASELTLDLGSGHVRLQADNLHIEASGQLTLNARHFANRAEVMTQAASERQTHISGTDATHAGCTMMHTERHLGLHAKSAAVTASGLLKVDAAQIHMG